MAMKYELDPHNRLIAVLPRFRKVLDGRFRTGKNNSLVYHVKAPVPEGASMPHQIKIKGKWAINKNHDLEIMIDKWGRKTFGDKITLKGEIIDVKKNSLLFAVSTVTKNNTRMKYVIDLAGSWQADKNNRLTFKVKKEKGDHDILTLDGVWEINNHHQIIYSYKRSELKRKRKKLRTLAFKGRWDIKDRAALSYVIDKNSDSVFNFKTDLGVFKGGYIKYSVGIKLSRRKDPVKKNIVLHGSWKVRPGMPLTFEVKYENGKPRAINFGAEARLTKNDTITLRLKKDTLDKDLGVSLGLSHKILKGNGTAFLDLLRSKKESAVMIGAGYRW